MISVVACLEYLGIGILFGIGFFGTGIGFLWGLGKIFNRGLEQMVHFEEEEEYDTKELKDNEGYH